MNKNIQRCLVMAGAVAVSGAALAGGPDLTPLTSTVDMGTTINAVLAIAATLAGLFVAIRGAKTVIGMIKGK